MIEKNAIVDNPLVVDDYKHLWTVSNLEITSPALRDTIYASFDASFTLDDVHEFVIVGAQSRYTCRKLTQLLADGDTDTALLLTRMHKNVSAAKWIANLNTRTTREQRDLIRAHRAWTEHKSRISHDNKFLVTFITTIGGVICTLLTIVTMVLTKESAEVRVNAAGTFVIAVACAAAAYAVKWVDDQSTAEQTAKYAAFLEAGKKQW